MAQSYDKYELDNDNGKAFRLALNDILFASATQNSGDDPPNTGNTSYAYQVWVDTTNDIVKIRDAATAGSWYSLYSVDSDGKPTGAVSYGSYTIATNDTAGNGGTPAITVDTSQNVGIGETSPDEPLHITASDPAIKLQDSDGTDQYSIIKNAGGDSIYDAVNGTGVGGDHIFRAPTGSANEHLRITSSGDVGIGETSPNGRLHVADSGNAILRIQTTDDNQAIINFNGSGASTLGQILYNVPSNYMRFFVNSAERARITQGGFTKHSDNSTYVNSTGDFHEFTQSSATDLVTVFRAYSNSYAAEIVRAQCNRAANSAYSFFLGESNLPSPDNEFNLRGNGVGYSDGGWTTPASDYAEYFEWEDGNSENEDRRGISVVLDGTTIREAVAGEEPLGIISARPSIVGDAATERWKEKYLTDDFGSYIMEPHNVVSWTDEDGNKHEYQDFNMPEDVVVPDDAVIAEADENGVPFTHRKLNPDYDPNQTYISREHRPEWDTVGLLGKLRMRKGQVTGSRWIKMRDISDTVEEWLVR